MLCSCGYLMELGMLNEERKWLDSLKRLARKIGTIVCACPGPSAFDPEVGCRCVLPAFAERWAVSQVALMTGVPQVAGFVPGVIQSVLGTQIMYSGSEDARGKPYRSVRVMPKCATP
jgi:hypothetical protein